MSLPCCWRRFVDAWHHATCLRHIILLCRESGFSFTSLRLQFLNMMNLYFSTCSSHFLTFLPWHRGIYCFRCAIRRGGLNFLPYFILRCPMSSRSLKDTFPNVCQKLAENHHDYRINIQLPLNFLRTPSDTVFPSVIMEMI